MSPFFAPFDPPRPHPHSLGLRRIIVRTQGLCMWVLQSVSPHSPLPTPHSPSPEAHQSVPGLRVSGSISFTPIYTRSCDTCFSQTEASKQCCLMGTQKDPSALLLLSVSVDIGEERGWIGVSATLIGGTAWNLPSSTGGHFQIWRRGYYIKWGFP